MTTSTKVQIDELLKKIPVSGSYDSALYARQISKLVDEVDMSSSALTPAEEEAVFKKVLDIKAILPNMSFKEAREKAMREILTLRVGG